MRRETKLVYKLTKDEVLLALQEYIAQEEKFDFRPHVASFSFATELNADYYIEVQTSNEQVHP